MTMPVPKPKRPLPHRPTGYVCLGNYSSLGTFWRYLRGAQAGGRTVTLLRGDDEDTARRRISGHTLEGAGFLLDVPLLLRELEHGFDPHPALVALLAGDAAPVRAELSEHYALHTGFVLALTAARELVVRPEFTFKPLEGHAPTLSQGLKLRGRRLSKDELGVLLARACGV